MRGLEPPRPYGHTDLNRARLPIPPHPRAVAVYRRARLLLRGAELLLDALDVLREIGLALGELRLTLLDLGQPHLELVLVDL
jgi:hypothetical protein